MGPGWCELGVLMRRFCFWSGAIPAMWHVRVRLTHVAGASFAVASHKIECGHWQCGPLRHQQRAPGHDQSRRTKDCRRHDARPRVRRPGRRHCEGQASRGEVIVAAAEEVQAPVLAVAFRRQMAQDRAPALVLSFPRMRVLPARALVGGAADAVRVGGGLAADVAPVV